MKLHVWVPDYVSAMGGIQTLSRFLVRAIGDCAPDAQVTVLSKNDVAFPKANADVSSNFVSVGWWSRRLRTAAFSARLLTSAIRDRPDLIVTAHVNFSPIAHLLERLLGTPFIAIGNGIEVWDIPSRSIRHALVHANRLLAISEFTRQRMADELGCSPSRIRVFPVTFDEDTSIAPKPRFLLKRYSLRDDQPVLLTVSRLASAERYKGYDQVLRALSEIRKIFPDIRYILGGRGPDRGRVVGLIKELGLDENVILAGYIPDHELAAHYNLCDVFAMPSKGEGFGIVFLEAMACGKPVIAGNKDGSVDAVLDGELGVLVDPDDVAQIAEAIIAILTRQKADKLKSEVTEQKSDTGKGEVESREDELGSRKEKVGNAEVAERNAGGELQVESRKSKVENKQSDLRSSISDLPRTSDLRPLSSGPSIPEVIFHPQELRRRVIETYGYEKFKERLAAILGPLLNEKVERLK